MSANGERTVGDRGLECMLGWLYGDLCRHLSGTSEGKSGKTSTSGGTWTHHFSVWACPWQTPAALPELRILRILRMGKTEIVQRLLKSLNCGPTFSMIIHEIQKTQQNWRFDTEFCEILQSLGISVKWTHLSYCFSSKTPSFPQNFAERRSPIELSFSCRIPQNSRRHLIVLSLQFLLIADIAGLFWSNKEVPSMIGEQSWALRPTLTWREGEQPRKWASVSARECRVKPALQTQELWKLFK